MNRLKRKRQRELEESYSKVEWYVKRLAGYISSICNVSFDDLIQEGFIGVTRAHELYNPKLASFLTYAQYWIKMSMFSLAYKNTYIMEVPEEFHSIYSKYRKLKKEHKSQGKNLSYKQAAAILKVTHTRLQRIVDIIQKLKMRCSVDYVENKLYSTIDLEKRAEDRSEDMIKILKRVATPEEVFVIDHMLGLTRNIPKTLSWVGNILGVTKERVRQIKNSGLDKLKHELEFIEWNNDGF